jgi:hypothetical protein
MSRMALMIAPFLARNPLPLDMDFTTGVLDPRITFTRGSAGTRINALGQIESVGNNLPRFDYDPVTLQPKGLLVEEQRTNKCLAYANPTDLTNATKSGDAAATLTVVSDTVELAAAGLAGICSSGNVYKLDNSLGVGHARVGFGGAFGNTNDHTLSVYARGTGSLKLRTGYSEPNGAYSNLTGSYKRISYSQASGLIAGVKDAGDTMQVWATAGSVVYFILPQSEEGAFSTSVIPTAGSQVTRAADTAIIDGERFSRWFNPLEGTFVVDAGYFHNYTASPWPRILSVIESVSAPRTTYEIFGVNNTLSVAVYNNDVIQASTGGAAGRDGKVAFAYKYNDFGSSIKGSPAVVDNTFNVINPNKLSIGSMSNSAFINGHIRRLRYWPRRLSNAQLQELTT